MREPSREEHLRARKLEDIANGTGAWHELARETVEEMAARHAHETAKALGVIIGGGEPAKPVVKPSDYLAD